MGIIDWNGNTHIYGTDKQIIQKCKIIETAKCGKCHKYLPKGSVCLGKSTYKFCLGCADKLFLGIEKELTSFLNLMWKTKTDLEINKEEYENNNLVSSI